MDFQRAKEIVQSPAMTHVSYRGIPVYIKEVYAEQQTALIFPLDEMEHEQLVELNGLLDMGPYTNSK
jgi:small acid-soluble spore protein H (minor)